MKELEIKHPVYGWLEIKQFESAKEFWEFFNKQDGLRYLNDARKGIEIMDYTFEAVMESHTKGAVYIIQHGLGNGLFSYVSEEQLRGTFLKAFKDEVDDLTERFYGLKSFIENDRQLESEVSE